MSKHVFLIVRSFLSITILSVLLPGCLALTFPKMKTYSEPGLTQWKPNNIRPDQAPASLFGNNHEFRAFHSDSRSSDEVAIAYAPMFEKGWVAEPNFYIPEGPTFDSKGHIYFTPAMPKEKVRLVSVDGETGKRRWAIKGDKVGAGGAPLVLNSPQNSQDQIIYTGSYEHIMAVKSDGTILWDQPTHLKVTPGLLLHSLLTHNWGIQYLQNIDALVAVLGDGHVIVHDRQTGKSLLPPFKLPGAIAKPKRTIRYNPRLITRQVKRMLSDVMDVYAENAGPTNNVLNAVMGGGAVITNYFSIDPHTGRIWIASTAPDKADRTLDGQSEKGALYALTINKSENNLTGAYQIKEHCRYVFNGGSSSTPSLSADGKRVYVSDAETNLFAIDDRCNKIWHVDVKEQILASIAISSDNGELYAITGSTVIKVIDQGGYGRVDWRAEMDMFSRADTANLSVAGIGANGIMVHIGGGKKVQGHILPKEVGLALIDRKTGKARYAATGAEESIAAMTTSSNGAVYLAHSPIRKVIYNMLSGNFNDKVVGGIGQYRPIRLDLLARDATCAAKDRAKNLHDHLTKASKLSIQADQTQINTLIQQAMGAATKATQANDMVVTKQKALQKHLQSAGEKNQTGDYEGAIHHLTQACDISA